MLDRAIKLSSLVYAAYETSVDKQKKCFYKHYNVSTPSTNPRDKYSGVYTCTCMYAGNMIQVMLVYESVVSCKQEKFANIMINC